MSIHKLPAQLYAQIAAGEVVERPASVVKELLENAVDAGATFITLDISNAGRTLIRVRDNGSGIEKEDLPLALAAHATSKIACLEDLEAIATLGFRGEALASIAAVSQLTLTSRTATAPAAFAVHVEGSEQEALITPAAHPKGTTVEVRELFFNTPGRRRFLKSDRTELAHIRNLFNAIALSHPGVGFELNLDGKSELRLPPVTPDRFKYRLGRILSREFEQSALYFEDSSEGLTLKGYLLPPPPAASAAVDEIKLILNGRVVEDKILLHAVREAFRAVAGERVTARAVLFFTCPFSEVDVNVHPRKLEVRFHDSRLVHDFTVAVLSAALREAGAGRRAAEEDAEEAVSQGQEELFAPAHLFPPVTENAEAEGSSEHEAAAPCVTESSGTESPAAAAPASATCASESPSGRKNRPSTARDSHYRHLQPVRAAALSSVEVTDSASESAPLSPFFSAEDIDAFNARSAASIDRDGEDRATKATVTPDSAALTRQVSLDETAVLNRARADLRAQQNLDLIWPLGEPRLSGEPGATLVKALTARTAFIQEEGHFYLLRVDGLHAYLLAQSFRQAVRDETVPRYELTLPFEIKCEKTLSRALKNCPEEISRVGFTLTVKKESVLLVKVPWLLRSCDVAQYALKALHLVAAGASALKEGHCPLQLAALLSGAAVKTAYPEEITVRLLSLVNKGAALKEELGSLIVELNLQDAALALEKESL